MNGMVKPKTYGRMGNFLFQAAAAMGYAWRHGMDYTLPNTTLNPKWNPIYLQHLVNPNWNPALQSVLLKEKHHGYQELPFTDCYRKINVILDGYWQSEKYFVEFRPQVLEAFGFPWSPLPKTVSVHIRRTDYLVLREKHPDVPKSWMENAMACFPSHQFVFFSDDIPWCKQEFGMREDCSFSEGHDEVHDLTHMACCEHNICSASTFSWWGMWLNRNPDKRVIFPKNWFQPGYAKTNVKDIVPEWCEKL